MRTKAISDNRMKNSYDLIIFKGKNRQTDKKKVGGQTLS